MTLILVACPEPGCVAVAEVVDRYVLDSTSGPVTHEATACVEGHRVVTTTD